MNIFANMKTLGIAALALLIMLGALMYSLQVIESKNAEISRITAIVQIQESTIGQLRNSVRENIINHNALNVENKDAQVKHQDRIQNKDTTVDSLTKELMRLTK